MFPFFKSIFGIADYPKHTTRNEDVFVQPESSIDDNSTQNYGTRAHVDLFSVFSHPLEMHKYFEQHMDDMLRRAFDFSATKEFQQLPQFRFTDDLASQQDLVPSVHDPEKLRDAFLKPGFAQTGKKEDTHLDGAIEPRDFEQFLVGPSVPESKPQVVFQSVTVRTVRRPDGSSETVRTVRDHTGREETTVTQSQDSRPLTGPTGQDDIISKFFSS